MSDDELHLHMSEKAIAISVACDLLGLNPLPQIRQELISLIETTRDTFDVIDLMARTPKSEAFIAATMLMRRRRLFRETVSGRHSAARENELQTLAADMVREDQMRAAINTREATVAVSAGAMRDLISAVEGCAGAITHDKMGPAIDVSKLEVELNSAADAIARIKTSTRVI